LAISASWRFKSLCRGFDFLGYRISIAGLIGLAAQSVQQTTDRMSQLYEQGADDVRAAIGAGRKLAGRTVNELQAEPCEKAESR
jgi:hypothetical protein